VSNLERHPAELVMDCTSSRAAGPDGVGTVALGSSGLGPNGTELRDTEPDDTEPDGIELLAPREVPLGGPRAMTVHRTLPQRGRSTIGGWCFLDHYGPDDVAASGGMRVPPHPHIGLQTVSWLFEGEVEHRDSVGSHALVRPGELNLMTAGHGISHSEHSTPATTVLHGAQLWLALPDAWREHAPFFERTVPVPVRRDGMTARVFVGELVGSQAQATVFSPLVGAQLDLDAGAALSLELRPGFEHGILLDSGDVEVDGVSVPHRNLAYLTSGRTTLSLSSRAGARLLLIGGEPLGEQLVMWWNFVGRSHDDIAAARAQWQREAIDGADVSSASGATDGADTSSGADAPSGVDASSAIDGTQRFGVVAGDPDPALPAPALPTVRLKPRR
jgi:redox-sensitive bicupin YhaK (pirin superfamily)